MSIEHPVLRVLVVADEPGHAEHIAQTLTNEGFSPMGPIGTCDDFAHHIKATGANVVLIDTECPSPQLLGKVSQVETDSARPIVMFSQDEGIEKMAASISAGVTAYVVNGLCSIRFRPFVDAAVARFRHSESIQFASSDTPAAIQDRKMVDRAKSILMSRRNVDEPTALRTLQKLSLNLKRRLADVARELVEYPGASMFY